jgi:hypothetical protein
MRYTAIVVSRTMENVDFSISSLRTSTLLDRYLVVWDGETLPKHTYPVTSFVPKPSWADVYAMYNYGVSLSKTSWVLLANDDMYFPPNWDIALEEITLDPNAFYTFSLVESGWMAVNERNIERDFGRTVATFDREGFTRFAKDSTHELAPGLGWYMPLLLHRKTFETLGGYPTIPPFPSPNDTSFFNTARAKGVRFMKIDSMVYHLQCLSQR